jgi:hypothetical protein
MVVLVKYGYVGEDDSIQEFIVDTDKFPADTNSRKLFLDIVKDAVDDIENEISVDDSISAAFETAIQDEIVDSNIKNYKPEHTVTIWWGD